MHSLCAMVKATVRFWHAEKGWGVLDSPETPGGCWVHFSHFADRSGYLDLQPGQQVDLVWQAPGFKQDRLYDYRAVTVRLESPERSVGAPSSPGRRARSRARAGCGESVVQRRDRG